MTSRSYKKCEYDVNKRPLDGNIPTDGVIVNENIYYTIYRLCRPLSEAIITPLSYYEK